MKLEDVPAVVTIASGKGGVGKTTVTTDLAQSLSNRGYTVGVIDADISTPNTPSVLTGGDGDFSDQRLSDGDSLIPVDADGVQLISQGLSLPDDVAMLRDGSFRAEAVAEYIQHVEWDDDTDIVLVDSPPGSGEELQVVLSAAQPDYTYIVTTSHSSSLQDAHRTSSLMEQADVPAGVVVNMTAVPKEEVVDAALDKGALREIDGIGEAKADAIEEKLRETAVDLRLFNSNTDIADAVGNEVVVSVPYTEDVERRRSVYDDIVPSQFIETEAEVEA